MTLKALLDRLVGVKANGSGFVARCPAHADRTPSLSVKQDGNKVLLYCHAGCSTHSVLAALNLSERDLFDAEETVYPYRDEQGVLLFEVVRLPGKRFFQRKPDGTTGIEGVRRVLFRLQEIPAAGHIVIVEGEKDVLTAEKFGLIATCNPMGAGKWLDEYSECLRGKNITIIPDADDVGIKHAEQVARSLLGKAASVTICKLPDGIKDLSDYPFSRESLRELIDRAPQWSEHQEPVNWTAIFDSLEDFQNAQPLRLSIERFLQNDSATAIAGLSGHAKTFILLSIAKALLAGPPAKLWNLFPVTERAERLVYLIPESTRSPFKHRLEKMGLMEHIASGRLLVRTLSKGPTLTLDDPRILHASNRAHVILDTMVRFAEGEENSASDNQRGLATDIFNLLAAGARSVLAAHHAAKSFAKDSVMTLENVLRGSGDVGAMLGACYGVKQIDPESNIVHIECVKSRDFQPSGPFQIIGRPYIDETGDFRLLRSPAECGSLHQEHHPVDSNDQKRNERLQRVAIVAAWMAEDPSLSSTEMVAKFKAMGVEVDDSSVRRYKAQARKG